MNTIEFVLQWLHGVRHRSVLTGVAIRSQPTENLGISGCMRFDVQLTRGVRAGHQSSTLHTWLCATVVQLLFAK